MEHIVVVTAVGTDRPGMIAALTQAVLDAEGTLDDATMTRLHGAFATMLAARLPSPAAVQRLRIALEPIGARLGLTVTVQTVPETHAETPPDIGLNVYGADRPGIVHAVTRMLGERGVNITDMDTRVAGTPDAPLYVMLLEASSNGRDLTADLETLRKELGVDITRHDLDAEAL